jgi:hypothetical protein
VSRREDKKTVYVWLCAVATLGCTLNVAAANRADPVVGIASAGWTVNADPTRSTLEVVYGRLGTVIRGIQLQAGEQGARAPLRHLTATRRTPQRLEISTLNPRTAWVLELTPELLRITTTARDAALSGSVPMPPGRTPARLLDPAGAPVTWAGTAEIVHTYGGAATPVPSFLPRRHPEVMSFSLGLAAGSLLHSIFDRSTDTAVEFAERTLMTRGSGGPQTLDVTIPVPGQTEVRIVAEYFTHVLGVPYYVPFDESHFPRPPMVWSSWTSYYEHVSEADIVHNTDWIAANLKPYGFQFIVLDDGYDRGAHGEHYWIEKWDQGKFPHGPQWLAGYIRQRGLHPGLWLVPNAYAGAVREHPDWYLRDRGGKPVLDYATPALDATHPGVIEFLKREFTTLDSWGFEYYKFDGEHAIAKYAPLVDRSRLYDPAIDPRAAYRKRLEVIRDTIGAGRFLEGCPAGAPLDGVGYFDSYFNGEDVYNSWQGMYALFDSIYANAFLNRMVAYVMPGEGMELSPTMTVAEATVSRNARVLDTAREREDPLRGFGTSVAEARTLVSQVALSGVAYSVVSVMTDLPQERVELLKKTLPTLPIQPLDLFSRGNDIRWDTFKRTTADTYAHHFPEVLDVKVSAESGVYDVAALSNWRTEPVNRELSFDEQLGLPADAPYLVFDFWQQRLLGVFLGRMSVEIEPHDTRVLTIRPALERPQLVGISRHISGSFSVLSLDWDAATYQLRGSSQSVPGEDYTLFIHVPKGIRVAGVAATAGYLRGVPVRQTLTGDLLQVTFTGQARAVRWTVSFLKAAGTAIVPAAGRT